MAVHGTPDTTLVTLARLLAWQRDMGVDAVVGETAIDWLAPQGDRPARSPGHGFKIAPHGTEHLVRATDPAASPTRQPAPGTPKPPLPDRPRSLVAASQPHADSATAAASARVVSATDLDALRTEIEHFEGCALKKHATHLCFYRGAAKARVMIIGEAPGREEDLAGKPFVGPAGRLLDRMLAAIGLGEAETHITNAVYWRPPGNRQPTVQETLACRPFLIAQIELVAPEIILPMGGIAASSLLDTAVGITRLRGKWTSLQHADAPARRVLPTLHPSYLLRSPAAKRQAWHDLRLLRRALDGEG